MFCQTAKQKTKQLSSYIHGKRKWNLHRT